MIARARSLLALAAASRAALDGIRIDAASSTWRDAKNRSRLWHGLNFVNKQPPYYPTISNATLTTMRAMGMNAVRLGVMADGLFPNSSTPDRSYLAEIVAIVDALWSAGFATIVDLHQDVLAASLCGEGFPDWAIDTTALGAMAFPRPLTLNGSAPAANGSGWSPPVPCGGAGPLAGLGWSEYSRGASRVRESRRRRGRRGDIPRRALDVESAGTT